ncbi:hypothetical protein BPOR_0157g00060 [Botrytis porri]|uniref:Uncharacterized protein n=1 Tax=Botrytis porri TaxID=87229 RepID=A0A4Z1KVE7_9HELO|nr:hypothetical protein BPOR_0157g00060 [Botrytis porri]
MGELHNRANWESDADLNFMPFNTKKPLNPFRLQSPIGHLAKFRAYEAKLPYVLRTHTTPSPLPSPSPSDPENRLITYAHRA